jgi:hypothetical protein
VCCVGRGLCDGLICHSEESYGVCVSICVYVYVCHVVCVLETLKPRRLESVLGTVPKREKYKNIIKFTLRKLSVYWYRGNVSD